MATKRVVREGNLSLTFAKGRATEPVTTFIQLEDRETGHNVAVIELDERQFARLMSNSNITVEYEQEVEA